MLSVGAAWFDYDNDGLLDLIVTNYTTWTPQTDKQCFMDAAHEEYCDPRIYKSIESRLYRNLGHGRFEDVTEASGIGKALGKGMGISIADFNGDGLMDIFIANDTEPNFLFINQGDGTFKESGLEYGVAYNEEGDSVSGMGSDAKDFDNDGWVDIIYNDLAGQVFAHSQERRRKVIQRSDLVDQAWPALAKSLGLEHRVYRLQQRRLEGHLLREWRRGQPDRVFQAARHHVRERRRQDLSQMSRKRWDRILPLSATSAARHLSI